MGKMRDIREKTLSLSQYKRPEKGRRQQFVFRSKQILFLFERLFSAIGAFLRQPSILECVVTMTHS